MKLAPLQGKAAHSVRAAVRRINLWHGSVRSAKTVSSLVAFLRFVREAPPGELLIVARTERTAKANVIDVLESWLGRKRCRYVKGSGELWLLGRRVYVVGASNEKAEERIRGRTLVGAYVDEASLLPESFWNMLLSRLSLPGARLFATTNPDSPFHYLKQKFIDREGELDIAVFHFTLDDNPHLTTAYKEDLKAEFGGPGTLWYRRFILGQWVVAEGAIYDMWTDGYIVRADPARSDIARAWVAIDYGTATTFAALLLLHVTWPSDHILVAREWRWDAAARNQQLTDAEYSRALRDWLKAELPIFERVENDLERIYVDPSATSFINQLSIDRFRHVTLADNEVLDGIRSVSNLLAARRLFVRDVCTGLIEEFPGYSWDPVAQKRGEDRPLKVRDHSLDTLRYGVHSRRALWRRWVTEVEKAA